MQRLVQRRRLIECLQCHRYFCFDTSAFLPQKSSRSLRSLSSGFSLPPLPFLTESITTHPNSLPSRKRGVYPQFWASGESPTTKLSFTVYLSNRGTGDLVIGHSIFFPFDDNPPIFIGSPNNSLNKIICSAAYYWASYSHPRPGRRGGFQKALPVLVKYFVFTF